MELLPPFLRHFLWVKLSASTLFQVKIACFMMERLHRATAYGTIIFLAGSGFSHFSFFALGAGLFIDLFDTAFQLMHLRDARPAAW